MSCQHSLLILEERIVEKLQLRFQIEPMAAVKYMEKYKNIRHDK